MPNFWNDTKSRFGQLWHHPLKLGCLALAALFVLAGYLTLTAFSYLGPLGAFVLLTVLFGVWLYLSQIDRQRKLWDVSGHCTTCGYDLRMTTDVCPECGHPIPENLARMRRLRDHFRAARQAGPNSDPPTGQSKAESPPTNPEDSAGRD